MRRHQTLANEFPVGHGLKLGLCSFSLSASLLCYAVKPFCFGAGCVVRLLCHARQSANIQQRRRAMTSDRARCVPDRAGQTRTLRVTHETNAMSANCINAGTTGAKDL